MAIIIVLTCFVDESINLMQSSCSLRVPGRGEGRGGGGGEGAVVM